MKEFDDLVEVMERLLGPDGCAWDRKQTFETLRATVLEETHEVIEAINLKDYPHLCEELGDLFLNCIFLCKLGEKGGHFSLEQALQGIIDKLIRRHPHVFGETTCETEEEVMAQWSKIKAEEKKGKPPQAEQSTQPALAQLQKRLKLNPHSQPPEGEDAELELGAELFALVKRAQEQKIDAEQALLKTLARCD